MHVRVTNKLKHVGNFANLSIISATAEKNKKKVGKKSNFIYLQYYFSIIELDCCFQWKITNNNICYTYNISCFLNPFYTINFE